MAKLRPLRGFIVAQRKAVHDDAVKNSAGLWIPSTTQEAQFYEQMGKVVAVSEFESGSILDPIGGGFFPVQVKVGDEIVWFPGAGQNAEQGGVPHVILREHEIMAVLEHDAVPQAETPAAVEQVIAE